ncbi:hypothetical protein CC80DRAFT_506120 [Byssothecium circinans]|uniref:Uncharacterized protein n=1 Tax=Byssothecium circinans TaxID=147558 RepID=A0A6A5TQB7_9PLEO|nr:hypothetical protein CC80DRAFT_506120 [Byssothecium circinans]
MQVNTVHVDPFTMFGNDILEKGFEEIEKEIKNLASFVHPDIESIGLIYIPKEVPVDNANAQLRQIAILTDTAPHQSDHGILQTSPSDAMAENNLAAARSLLSILRFKAAVKLSPGCENVEDKLKAKLEEAKNCMQLVIWNNIHREQVNECRRASLQAPRPEQVAGTLPQGDISRGGAPVD